jgi:hypothetical protein
MSKTSQAAMAPSRRARDLVDHLTDSFASKTRHWWLLLIAGVTWIVIGLAIPRFAYATAATLAILAGVFCLVAAPNEVMAGAMMSSRGGRIARGSLAVLFVVAGVVAFLGVNATIVGLGAVMSVLLSSGGPSVSSPPSLPTENNGGGCCRLQASPSSRSDCRSQVR